jgi:hypothetical protein
LSILDEMLSQARYRQVRDYLRLFMKGLPQPMTFPLAEKDLKLFKKRVLKPIAKISPNTPTFYWLSTLNGKEVLISFPDIEYISFLFEIEKPLIALLADSQHESELRAEEDRHDGTVDLYFRGRSEPISIRVDSSKELKRIFETLTKRQKKANPPAFVRFTDNNNQLVIFRPQRLVLLVAHRGSMQVTTDSEYEALFRFFRVLCDKAT